MSNGPERRVNVPTDVSPVGYIVVPDDATDQEIDQIVRHADSVKDRQLKVRDNMTGEEIPFIWHAAEDPTDIDLEEIASEYRRRKTQPGTPPIQNSGLVNVGEI